MRKIQRSYTIVAVMMLAVISGLQNARAADIVPADIANGTNTYTTGDGLVTLTPLAEGLVAGTFDSNGSSLIGITGGFNANSLGDRDGDPATTADREALDMDFDATVGLTRIALLWTPNNAGPAFSNGVPSGVVISGFTEDPGIWTEFENVDSTYTNGSLYFPVNNFTGTPKIYSFASAAASKGQVLRLSVNDADTADPRFSINSLSYGTDGIEPPAPPATPNGYVSWSNVVDGATNYISGDGFLTMTPYSAGLTNVGAFGVDATGHFGVQGGLSSKHIDDVDGDPVTTADREALDLALDASVGLTQIAFRNSRADGTASNGVPAGIVISGFSEDPGCWSETTIVGTYTNGAIYIDIPWSGTPRTFYFTNLTASAGQTLRISGNDFDEGGPWVGINYIGFGDENDVILPPPPPPPILGTIGASNILGGATNYVTGDGLVTLIPYAQGLTNGGTFGSNGSSLFGVTGGGNNNNIIDTDGNPATTADREAIDIILDVTVGLRQIEFAWARANGPAANDGIVISGFVEDPDASFSGTGTLSGNGVSYSAGSLYVSIINWSGNTSVIDLSNMAASAGQTLRLSVNDSDQTGPVVAMRTISYSAYTPAVESAVLSISSGSGQVLVTAHGMGSGMGVTNTLQGATSLVPASWVDISSTTGVDQVIWPVSTSDPNKFFRVKSE